MESVHLRMRSRNLFGRRAEFSRAALNEREAGSMVRPLPKAFGAGKTIEHFFSGIER
jgi:hypothetical protein